MVPPDPSRPWILDPEDVPARLNWMDTCFNPAGSTSRLHFTRVWTVLFLSRVLLFAGIVLFSAIFSIAAPGQIVEAPNWLFPLFILITGLISLVIHLRRLSNAKRHRALGLVAMVPILIGGFGLLVGVGEGARNYDVAVEASALQQRGIGQQQIAIDFDRREVYRTLSRDVVLRLVRKQVAEGRTGNTAKTSAFAETGNADSISEVLAEMRLTLTSDQRSRLDSTLERTVRELQSPFAGFSEFLQDTDSRGLQSDARSIRERWERHLPDIDLTNTDQRSYAFGAGIGTFYAFWAIPAFIVMLWSLLWLGRLPNGGGTVKQRLQSLNNDAWDWNSS